MTAFNPFTSLLSHRSQAPQKEMGTATAPANIALCKYWGKRDEVLNLPVTSSLSVSLGDRGTQAELSPADEWSLSINGAAVAKESKVFTRCIDYLTRFDCGPHRVETTSTVPVGAGLASSASAFAALVAAMDDLYGWELDLCERSILARLGSGSASRSVCPGFVEWQAGERPDGMDSHALPLDAKWPELRLGILMVSDQPKPIGSRAAMRRTRETSVLYNAWPSQVERDLDIIRAGIMNRDLRTVGPAAESNALAMHATMLASTPPVCYFQPASMATLHQLWTMRAEGLQAYATMDAGPNVKLIFEAKDEDRVREAFPNVDVVVPV